MNRTYLAITVFIYITLSPSKNFHFLWIKSYNICKVWLFCRLSLILLLKFKLNGWRSAQRVHFTLCFMVKYPYNSNSSKWIEEGTKEETDNSVEKPMSSTQLLSVPLQELPAGKLLCQNCMKTALSKKYVLHIFDFINLLFSFEHKLKKF